MASNKPEGDGLASFGQSHSQSQNAKLVQRYLGHSVLRLRSALMVSAVEPSDVATTLRYYVDVFPEDLEEAAEMLAEE